MYTIIQPISTLSATFKFNLRWSEIPAFRGAIVALAGREKDLFHNHDNDPSNSSAYKQRYPLIQYRIQDGKAAIFGLNQGADNLEQLLYTSRLSDFKMNGRPHPLQIVRHDRDRGFRPEILADGDMLSYRIRSYLPFSAENYKIYKSQCNIRDKVDILERLLRNHIVSFTYGVKWPIPDGQRIQVVLNEIEKVKKITILKTNLMGFDLSFRVNAHLPAGIGLGRSTAFGCGVTSPFHSKLVFPC